MTWRLARSLETLRDQVNNMWPGRDKTSDGTIGDARHRAEISDHNPNAAGVVTAEDIDADLSGTDNVGILAAALVASRDPRIKYIIWNRQMVRSYAAHGLAPWQWGPYNGVNAHKHHMHVSVSADPKLYDDTRPWNLDRQAPLAPIQEGRDLVIGMVGNDVLKLQQALIEKDRSLLMLIGDPDGKFGPHTQAAVKKFQGSQPGLTVDGIAGKATKRALGI